MARPARRSAPLHAFELGARWKSRERKGRRDGGDAEREHYLANPVLEREATLTEGQEQNQDLGDHGEAPHRPEPNPVEHLRLSEANCDLTTEWVSDQRKSPPRLDPSPPVVLAPQLHRGPVLGIDEHGLHAQAALEIDGAQAHGVASLLVHHGREEAVEILNGPTVDGQDATCGRKALAIGRRAPPAARDVHPAAWQTALPGEFFGRAGRGIQREGRRTCSIGTHAAA